MFKSAQKQAPRDPLGDIQKLVGLIALLLGAGYLGYRFRHKILRYYQLLVDKLEEQKDYLSDERYVQAVEVAKEVERRLLDHITPEKQEIEPVKARVPVTAPSKPQVPMQSAKPVAAAKPASQAAPVKQQQNAFALNERQEIVYKLIKSSKKATMAEIEGVVPGGVTNRTLRRDMNKLEKLGLVEKLGKTKDTYYKLRS